MRMKLAAVLFVCAAALSQGQAIQVPPVAPPAEASQSTATIHQTVNNVLIDVVVTDKNGQPIKDLAKERFQVLENGAPQQIVFFEEHHAAPAPPAAAPQPALPPQIYTNISTTASDTGPTLVLLLDALNTPVEDQAKVRAALIEFLHKIPQGRHIAIFTLTSKLRMVQGFNNDPATLIATLNETENWQKQSHLTDSAGEDSYADFMTANLSRDSRYVAHEQAWRVDEKVAYTLSGLNSLATYLSALQGRKNLIWFSGSFPLGMEPDSAMPQGFDPSKFTSEDLDRSRNYDAALHKTSELLKLARVAVYPMAAGGLSTPTQFASNLTTNSLTSSTSSLANPATMLNNANLESLNIVTSNATMDTLAEATGGRAFHSTNDLAGALATVSQLASDYYTIAYAPKDSTYDGKYRKLAIKVDTPKAKLDYRRGYYAEDPDKSGASALAHPAPTAAVLLRGAPAATDILFKVRVAPTENAVQKQPGVVRYSVNWSIDPRGLTLPTSSNGMRHGGLELAVVAYNKDAKAINSVSTPASLILQPDEYAGYIKTGLRFHQELDLPTGMVYLRIAVFDTTAEHAGATEIPLNIQLVATQASSVQH